jgi:hypothetical protein
LYDSQFVVLIGYELKAFEKKVLRDSFFFKFKMKLTTKREKKEIKKKKYIFLGIKGGRRVRLSTSPPSV